MKNSLRKESRALKNPEAKIAINKRDTTDETIINGQLNAKIGEINFNYETANSGDKSEDIIQAIKDPKADFGESKNRLKKLMFDYKEMFAQMRALKSEQLTAEKAKRDLITKLELLKKGLSQTEVTPVFVLRNLPLIDFLDPTLRVQQTVLKNITDDRFFQQVPKVDRCITCHIYRSKRV